MLTEWEFYSVLIGKTEKLLETFFLTKNMPTGEAEPPTTSNIGNHDLKYLKKVLQIQEIFPVWRI